MVTQPIPDLTQTGYNVYWIHRFLENFSTLQKGPRFRFCFGYLE